MPGRIVAILVAGLLVIAGIGAALIMTERVTPVEETRAEPPAPEPAPAPEEAPLEAAPRPTPSPPRPTSEPAPPPPEPAPEPTTGSIRITSDVPETSVFVNREFLGYAPVTTADLPPGSHTVVMSPTGYDMVSHEVQVVAGEVAELNWDFKTIRLDAAAAVVHDHAFGSCQGTLRGSPEGITYETSNEDDAFFVAFADIETFSVDYLEATIQLKIRNGRTYNFTNEARDPEPLFAFHRDVDKVRLRVIRGGAEETGLRALVRAEGKGQRAEVRFEGRGKR